jgi:hypothetical protein
MIKYVLGSVSMVDIPVNDGNPVESIKGTSGGNGGIVENTESQVVTAPCMMTRRPDHREP